MSMKYILFYKTKSPIGKSQPPIISEPLMVVFSKHVDHDKMAEAVERLTEGNHNSWYRPMYRPMSAGFTDGSKCYGRSETLNLDSNPCDKEYLP